MTRLLAARWGRQRAHHAINARDPGGLVDWVAARRYLNLGDATVSEAELLRFRYNGRQPVRVALARAALAGRRRPAGHPENSGADDGVPLRDDER